MFITKKTYEDLKKANDNYKRIFLNLQQDYNSLAQENFMLNERIRELESKAAKKTTRKSTKKEEDSQETKQVKTRKPRTTKKEEK